MQGRTYETFYGGSPHYRYGFNGKENDDEAKGYGNEVDYGARVYDARLGRFLSLDPLYKKYPELTPYQFASNTPLQAVDLDGLEKYEIHYQPHDGKDNIIKVETDNFILYHRITLSGVPIRPATVRFIKEDRYGKTISKSEEIPLKNYGSTLYVGPWNPKDKNGNDRYDYPAINSLDAVAKAHDQAYDVVNSKGLKGAVYDLATLPADKDLVKGAQNVIDMFKNKQIDPVNKQLISEETEKAAEGVVEIFSKTVKEKTIRLEMLKKIDSAIDAIKGALNKIKETTEEGLKSLDNLDKSGNH